ncbi:MAG: hypothetical protein QXQ35_05890 [Candidatus Nezhaarchaeales archaeon]
MRYRIEEAKGYSNLRDLHREVEVILSVLCLYLTCYHLHLNCKAAFTIKASP